MSKRQVGPLAGDGIRLRLLEEPDLPMTRAWRNLDHIRCWFFHQDLIDEEGHRRWYERYRDRDDDFVFVIEDTRTLHRAIGQVSLYNIDWEAGTAEYGRLMIGDDEARGQGLARRATERLLEEAFGPLALRSVVLEVRSDNLPARAIYERAGFVEDGFTERGALRMLRRHTP